MIYPPQEKSLYTLVNNKIEMYHVAALTVRVRYHLLPYRLSSFKFLLSYFRKLSHDIRILYGTVGHSTTYAAALGLGRSCMLWGWKVARGTEGNYRRGGG